MDTLFFAVSSFCFPTKTRVPGDMPDFFDTFFKSLPIELYAPLLKNSACMVGNSSSGIMETPSLALPTVDIGMRQQGRLRADNVLDAPARREAILQAIRRARAPEFRRSLAGMTSPYGDGHAAERIVRVLMETTLGEELLLKKALPDAPAAARS